MSKRITRRELIAGGMVAAGMGVAGVAGEHVRAESAAAGRPRSPRRGSGTTTTTPTTASANPAQWLIDENAQQGSADWTVADDPIAWEKIRGFAPVTSALRGDTVALRVSTGAPAWKVDAYRVGWYRGSGARLVWSSATQPGERQDPAVQDPGTLGWTAKWKPNIEIPIGHDWPPGCYLFKLTSSDGGESFVPLTVRDDSSHSALLIQNSVTTWQAYNEWGGTSLYNDSRTGNKGRASIVTFDRPYYRNGTGEFFGREFEFILFAERNGLDVSYWTDVDLHARPELVKNHNALVSLAHDEYYSTSMRRGLESARDAGVNLVFLGANAIFRKIRLDPTETGDFRRQINYRSALTDPVARTDPYETTVSWRQAPVSDPESSVLGGIYESNPVEADMVVGNADAWLFEGSGLRNGDVLPKLIGNEYDRVTPEHPTPDNIEVMCHSPLVCKGKRSFADVTWYTAPSGAGVLDIGTFWWVPRLAADTTGRTPSVADPDAAVQQVTKNVLAAVAKGPAGRDHPSTNNLAQFGIHKGYLPDPPPT